VYWSDLREVWVNNKIVARACALVIAARSDGVLAGTLP
jgi:hypothetical protein